MSVWAIYPLTEEGDVAVRSTIDEHMAQFHGERVEERATDTVFSKHPGRDSCP